MKPSSNKSEQFNIQFLGMKFNSNNPGRKTIIIVLMILIFFLVLVLLLKPFFLPGATAIAGIKAISIAGAKISSLKKWVGGPSP